MPNLRSHHDFARPRRQAEPGATLPVQLERLRNVQIFDGNRRSSRHRSRRHENDLWRRRLNVFGFQIGIKIREIAVAADKCSPAMAKSPAASEMRTAVTWLQSHWAAVNTRSKSHGGSA